MDKDRFWSAFTRLSARDRIVIFLAVLVIVCGAAFGILKIVSNTSFSSFSFPDSTLQETDIAQTYRRGTYNDLPTLIRFKGTNYGASAKGEPFFSQGNAASFKSDDFTLVYAVKDATTSIGQLYTSDVLQALDGALEDTKSEYSIKIHDEGYLNATFATYEAGIISSGTKRHYVVSYLYNTGNKDIVIMVSVDEKDRQKLLEGKRLLDRIFYTLLTFSDDNSGVSENGSEKKKVVVDDTDVATKYSSQETLDNTRDSDVGGVAASSEKEESKEQTVDTASEEVSLTREEREAELKREFEERNFHMAYPNATDLDELIMVDSSLTSETVVFFFRYTNVSATPREAYLKTPDGDILEPTYLNTDLDGFVCFKVERPLEGGYSFHVSANAAYGSYLLDVLTEQAFHSVYGSVDDPQPKEQD